MINKFRPLHLLQGEKSEQIACDYLLKQGLSLLEKNFSCRYGEVDLIMKDFNTLVIVEVRFRKSNKFGGAIESITEKKQAKIIAATQFYLMCNKLNHAIRFDVIALSNNTEINWIKNAFP
ncbi:MAG: YraN family protein [Methylococcales symbiont of Hymedesmia sp. n. MRB-2018]|nr:MAG: YraN family protein [Methylococcales symbiont of Hymedesmia sp. n. MRB-2018]KAF3983114.1 MAG: YraN family protein [Methylococcales symbiont of Hymedesmia sp. n. MRB-2018]